MLPRALLILLATACTPLADPDERLDGGPPDMGTDAGTDTGPDLGPPDPCGDPAERPRVSVGDEVGGLGRIVAASQTWVCTNVFVLRAGQTYVQAGVDITIEPGTLVLAEPGADFVFQPGARLIAVGTREQPITIRGDDGFWGGLFLLGDAPINGGARLLPFGAEERVTFGGSDVAHDCGELSFVRVSRGGLRELGGIFLGACGTETTLDFVQVQRSHDDELRMDGGGFDVRHLVLHAGNGDGFRIDEGWRGTLQFGIVHHSIANEKAAIDAQGPEPEVGRTRLQAANLTLIGLHDQEAAIDLEAAGVEVFHSIVVGFGGVLNVSDSYLRAFGPDGIGMQNNLFAAQAEYFRDSELRASYAPPMAGNRVGDPEFSAATLSSALVARDPVPGELARTGAADTLPEGLEVTTYVGAVDPDGEDWTADWVQWTGL